jgi:hypothetical protein
VARGIVHSGAKPTIRSDRLTSPSNDLDLHTLFLVTIYIEANLGLLLPSSGRRIWRFAHFAHLLRLASIALFGMYEQIPDLISVDLANALFFTAFAVT